jgi:hypothetical protein
MDKIEESVYTNIHNFSIYNPNMYNKKLDGMYGSMDLTTPDRNLISLDISYSIPKAIGTTLLLMSKNLAENFYCDLIITGEDTIFIPYEEIHNMDIEKIYRIYGQSQECKTYRKLITEQNRNYKTCKESNCWTRLCVLYWRRNSWSWRNGLCKNDSNSWRVCSKKSYGK